jgi:streptogramin lyase
VTFTVDPYTGPPRVGNLVIGGQVYTIYQAGAATTTTTEYPIPTAGSIPLHITAGPDGALWFTEYRGNKIGRITTAGVITEYPVPTASSYVARISSGPDGTLWFTEPGADKIGRITTAGVITEYPVPTASSNVDDITAGPGTVRIDAGVHVGKRVDLCGRHLHA